MAFRVPEDARLLNGPYATPRNAGLYGAFTLPSPEPGWTLMIIADNGAEPEAKGWEHVSVHARASEKKHRTPTWKEMSFIKRIFWEPEDVVIQFHPKESEYVNTHPSVLHLWRNSTVEFPTPPRDSV